MTARKSSKKLSVYSSGSLVLTILTVLFLFWAQNYLDNHPSIHENVAKVRTEGTSKPSQKTSKKKTYVVDPVYQEDVFVTKVIDGDTIELETGEHVRLIGIDTPESRKNEKAKKDSLRTRTDLDTIVKMGLEAKKILNKIVYHKKIRLEFDVTQRDKYGRLLAYVYLYRSQVEDTTKPSNYYLIGDEIFVNASMVKLGYASPMTITPNVKYASLFKELFAQARNNNQGLWENAVAKTEKEYLY
jgi:micrococcal nuclease